MPYRMLVVGDSVLWGQGLLETEKITTLVASAIGAVRPGGVEITRFAHSGAEVWLSNQDGPLDALDPSPPRMLPPPGRFDDASIDALPDQSLRSSGERDAIGEIPLGTPYTPAQVRAAEQTLGPGVDFVLVNGGINDTRVTNIVLPFKDAFALDQRARSFAGYMRALLEYIHVKFPNAVIVVAGYYPIASTATDFSRMLNYARGLVECLAPHPEFWTGHGFSSFEHAVEDALTGVPHLVGALGPVATVEQHLARLSAVFVAGIHETLAADLAAFNASVGRNRAALAIPQLAPQNSIYAPASYLFDVNLLLHPQDPMASQRATACARCGPDPMNRFACDRASVGHPNVLGARAFADAVMARWKAIAT